MTTLIPKYDQGSTGAINRPINEKLAESISVLDFGAIGDYDFSTSSGTDNSSAFQLAIDALPNGGRLHIPHGYYLLNSSVTLTHGIEIVGDGQVNFNQYATTTATAPNGGSLIVIANGITAFAFDKGTDATSFGNSFKDLSFSSKTISEASYNNPPVYPSNTNAINMSYTAEMFVDNVGFMNIDKCFYNTLNQLAVKPYINNIAIKDCNYGFYLVKTSADFTITNVSCIKANYFIYTNQTDGVTLSDSTIYRSYVNAWKCEPNATSTGASSFFNITGTKFFESGNTLLDFDHVTQITMAGCDLVRAGLVSGYGTGHTALSVQNCEVFTIGGSTIERPTGNGAYIYNTRVIEFNANIKEFGWGVGGYTGLIADSNININLDASISGFNGSPLAAANLTNNYFVGGNVTSDDIIYGQTTYISQVGVETSATTVAGQTLPNNGGANLGQNLPYTLLPGQSLVIYNIVYPVALDGLTFRFNSDFTTTLDNSGDLNIRKVVQANTTGSPISNTFDTYLWNLTGSSVTISSSDITFLYKVVQTTLPEYA